MNIVPSERIDWPPPYKDATEKYSSQVRLTNDHRIAGRLRRRPAVPADRHQRSASRDQDHVEQRVPPDQSLTTTICVSSIATPSTVQAVHRRSHTTSGRPLRRLRPGRPHRSRAAADRSRLQEYQPPVAVRPVSAARAAGSARPGPASLSLCQPTQGDDTWTWNTGSRRVRRLNESLNSSATGAQSFDPDHYSGFNPEDRRIQLQVPGRERDARDGCMPSIHRK